MGWHFMNVNGFTRLLTIVFTVLYVTNTAMGHQRPGFQRLDLVIDKPIYQDVCDTLKLSEAQKQFADELFAEYFQKIKAFDESLGDLLLDAGQRESNRLYEEAEEAGEPIPYDLMEPHYVQAKNELAKNWRLSDRYLEDFLNSLIPGLTEQQILDLERVRRLVRRSNYLNTDYQVEMNWADYRRPINLSVIFKEGISEQGPLHSLIDPENIVAKATETEDVLAEINQSLEDWDASLDSIIRRIFRTRRQPIKNFTFIIDPNTEEGRETFRKKGISWHRRFTLHHRAAQHIQDILFAHFPDASYSGDWIDWYYSQLAPSVFHEDFSGDAVDWILQNPTVSEEQRQYVHLALAEYQDKRRQLRKRAFDQATQSILRFGDQWGYEPRQLEYGRSILAINQHHDRFLSTIGRMLDDQTRIEFHQAVDDARYSNSDIRGKFYFRIPSKVQSAMMKD